MSFFFYFLRGKSPTTMAKVPAAILDPERGEADKGEVVQRSCHSRLHHREEK